MPAARPSRTQTTPSGARRHVSCNPRRAGTAQAAETRSLTEHATQRTGVSLTHCCWGLRQCRPWFMCPIRFFERSFVVIAGGRSRNRLTPAGVGREPGLRWAEPDQVGNDLSRERSRDSSDSPGYAEGVGQQLRRSEGAHRGGRPVASVSAHPSLFPGSAASSISERSGNPSNSAGSTFRRQGVLGTPTTRPSGGHRRALPQLTGTQGRNRTSTA